MTLTIDGTDSSDPAGDQLGDHVHDDLDEQDGEQAGGFAGVRDVTLADHASAVVGQARLLSYGDVLDCGPGMCSALEDLAHTLARVLDGEAGQPELKGAALDLVDVTRATQPHRAQLDAAPLRHPPIDRPHEMYPRDLTVVPPRYSHADRRGALVGSITLMGEFLAA